MACQNTGENWRKGRKWRIVLNPGVSLHLKLYCQSKQSLAFFAKILHLNRIFKQNWILGQHSRKGLKLKNFDKRQLPFFVFFKVSSIVRLAMKFYILPERNMPPFELILKQKGNIGAFRTNS